MRVRFEGGSEDLAGVAFQADITDDGKISNLSIDPESADGYWDSLNKPYQLAQTEKYLQDMVNEAIDSRPADKTVLQYMLDEWMVFEI